MPKLDFQDQTQSVGWLALSREIKGKGGRSRYWAANSYELLPLDVRKLVIEKGIKEKPNIMKQRNGFAPNFIHSLDSSHMMLTSLYLWNLGITYASVHDCYWTHASSVRPMNIACREQFVRLHSLPILESLAQSFQDKYLL